MDVPVAEQKNVEEYMSGVAIICMSGMLILLIILSLYIGKYLWNTVLVRLLPTTVAPMNSVFEVIGLIILASILFGGMSSVSVKCYDKCNEYVCKK